MCNCNNLQTICAFRILEIWYFYTILLVEEVWNESGSVNLNNVEEAGIHLVAYAKRGIRVLHFDNFDNLRPSNLANSVKSRAYHRYNQNNCEQFYLQFLRTIDK